MSMQQTGAWTQAAPYAGEFDDWANDFDRWLTTPAGRSWLENEADAVLMRRDTEVYGTRPGLDS